MVTNRIDSFFNGDSGDDKPYDDGYGPILPESFDGKVERLKHAIKKQEQNLREARIKLDGQKNTAAALVAIKPNSVVSGAEQLELEYHVLMSQFNKSVEDKDSTLDRCDKALASYTEACNYLLGSVRESRERHSTQFHADEHQAIESLATFYIGVALGGLCEVARQLGDESSLLQLMAVQA